MMQACCLNCFELVDSLDGACNLNPPAILSRFNAIELVESVFAVFLRPQISGPGIERHAEAVSNAVRIDLLNVSPDLSAHARADVEKRIVRRRRSVIIEP